MLKMLFLLPTGSATAEADILFVQRPGVCEGSVTRTAVGRATRSSQAVSTDSVPVRLSSHGRSLGFDRHAALRLARQADCGRRGASLGGGRCASADHQRGSVR